jgi:hypothetical protein
VSGKNHARIRRYEDFTFARDGTIVEIRITENEKIAYYRVIRQGPFFLDDMANLRKVWTKGAEWQFLPWPR